MKNKSDNYILSKVKTIWHWAYWGLVLLLVVVTGAAIATGFALPGQVRLFVVRSGSMEPAIPTGSLVVVGQKAAYEQHDVITYLTEADANARNTKLTITHRIVEVRNEETGLTYVTKGDINDAPDRIPVPANQVLGRVLLHVPYIGYPVAYAKTQMGFVVLVVMPAILIIYSECMSIVRQVKQGVETSKQRHGHKKSGQKFVHKFVPIGVNERKRIV